MGRPLAVLVAGFLLEIGVLLYQEQEVPEVSSQRAGGHSAVMISSIGGLSTKYHLDENVPDETLPYPSQPGL